VSSFANKQENAELTKWFARVGPKLVHPPTDRPIRILKGPLGELLEHSVDKFAVEFGVDWNLEISEYLAYYRRLKPRSKADLFETTKESDLSMGGRRVGFSVDLARLLILVGDGFVMELPWRSLEKAINMQFKSLGFDGFLRTLRRGRGELPRPGKAS
jgi:hypothetical protein